MCKSIRSDKSLFAKAAQEAHMVQSTQNLKKRWGYVVPDQSGAQRFAGKIGTARTKPSVPATTFLH